MRSRRKRRREVSDGAHVNVRLSKDQSSMIFVELFSKKEIWYELIEQFRTRCVNLNNASP